MKGLSKSAAKAKGLHVRPTGAAPTLSQQIGKVSFLGLRLESHSLNCSTHCEALNALRGNLQTENPEDPCSTLHENLECVS